MSSEALKAYLEHLDRDADAARDMIAAVADLEGPAASEAVAVHARVLGFEVGTEDAEALRRAVAEHEGELSPEDLDQVAGGLAVGAVAAGIAAFNLIAGAGLFGLRELVVNTDLVPGSKDKTVQAFFSKW